MAEHGYSWFRSDKVIFEYHVKIKILKQEGQKKGDFTIPLFINNGYDEKLKSVDASIFNDANQATQESRFDGKNILEEKTNKNFTLKKIPLPDVRVGSIIEVKYVTESPYINIHYWEFQDDIPKIHTEYWVDVPSTMKYYVTLRGYLKLNKNEAIKKRTQAIGASKGFD